MKLKYVTTATATIMVSITSLGKEQQRRLLVTGESVSSIKNSIPYVPLRQRVPIAKKKNFSIILQNKEQNILPVTDKERATKQSKKVSTTKTKETNQSKSEKVSTKETKQSKSGSKAAREKVCSGEERIECGRGKRLLICLHERDGSNGRAVCMKENRILDHLRSHPNDYCGRCNQNEVPTSSPSRSPTTNPSQSPSRSPSIAPQPVTDLNWAQVGVDIDGENADDRSGNALAMSADGSRVAIGASGNDGNGDRSGHVRVYEFNGSSWSQIGQDIDGESVQDESGRSVSLSSDGMRVAVGALGMEGNSPQAGHVRVYEYDGSDWEQLGQDIDGESANDQSGYSVSLSSDGSRVAIGARGNDGNGDRSGHVRVYEFNGSVWSQVGQDIDGEDSGDDSGHSVSISSNGNILAIGAPDNDENGIWSGHVRVYEYDGSDWAQLGGDIDGENSNDESGYSVSLSANGSRVAVGAFLNDGINGSSSGHARVYEFDGSSWEQLGQDIDGESAGDRSGSSVSISSDGKRVAVGAPHNEGLNGPYSGHVRIYDYDGSTWSQIGQDIDGESADDRSGASVSLSSDGMRVAIGARNNDGETGDIDDNRGHVRVYEWPGV